MSKTGVTQRNGGLFDDSHDSMLTEFLAPPQSDDELGRLGKYRILEILGHGGMGVVFKGEDPRLKRAVAVKAMLPRMAASASASKRFLREAQAMAAIKHDHIVSIYEVDEDRGVPFLAMEFLHGESLDERIKRESAPRLSEVVRIGREIAEALAAAHAIGLIHRDIKPANIWLEARDQGSAVSGAREDEIGKETDSEKASSSGSSAVVRRSASVPPRVKILDFGLVRAAAQEAGLTRKGELLGSPSYMAPEQAKGNAVDARTDLFSLGVVLYRLLSGELPFKGNDSVSTLVNVVSHDPDAPMCLNSAVPKELSELVMQLLTKDPGQRPSSAVEVWQRLQALEKRPGPGMDSSEVTLTTTEAEATFDGDKPRQVPHRRLLKVGFGIALLLVAIAGGYLAVRTLRPAPKPALEDAAEESSQGSGSPSSASAPVVKITNPFDALDPTKIPPEERAPWQPRELVAVLDTHRGRYWGTITSLSFSPDSKSIMCCGDNRAGILLLDAATLCEKNRLLDFGDARFWAMLPDGKLVMASSGPNSILWLVEPKTQASKRQLDSGDLSNAVLSGDGKILAICKGLHEVQVWDLGRPSREPKLLIKEVKDDIRSLSLSQDGKILAASLRNDKNEVAMFWDLVGTEAKSRKQFTGYTNAKVSPDGKTAAAWDNGGLVSLLDIGTSDLSAVKKIDKAARRSELVFSPDSKTLACVSRMGLDNGVTLFDITAASPFDYYTLTDLPSPVQLAFAPDGRAMALSMHRHGMVRVWNLNGSDLPRERLFIDGSTEALAGVVAAPDRKTVATYGGNTIRLWDLSGGTPHLRGPCRGHTGAIEAVAFSQDSMGLASTSSVDRTVRVWDLSTADSLGWCKSRPGGLAPILACIAPDGKTLAGGLLKNGNPGVALWDLPGADASNERTFLPNAWTPAYAPDGKMLACYRSIKEKNNQNNMVSVVVWDVRGAELIERAVLAPPEGYAYDAALCPVWLADRTLLVPFRSKGVSVVAWKLDDTKPKPSLLFEDTHFGSPNAIVLASDGRSVAACSSEGKIWAWDLARHGESVLQCKMLSYVNSVSFAPDGRHLITANGNGTAYVLRLSGPETKSENLP
jgi:serine/threonine protein kinase